MSDDLLQQAGEVLLSVAPQVHRRFRDYCDLEDIKQEMWEWLLKHPQKIREWLGVDPDAEDFTEQYKSGCAQLAVSLRRHGEKRARLIKAGNLYDPRDEFFYDRSSLARLLPAAFDPPEWSTFSTPEFDPSMPRGRNAPNEGGNLQAMLVDIHSALVRLPEAQFRVLSEIYEHHTQVDHYAEAAGISRQAADKRVQRALDALIESLGGFSPYRGEGPGARRAVSNATAVAITRGAYE